MTIDTESSPSSETTQTAAPAAAETVSTDVTNAASSTAATDDTAASSTADQDGKDPPKPSLRDVVKSVVEQKPAEAAEGSSASEPESGAAAPDGELSDEEAAKLPFHQHPRWKQIYGENKQFRSQLAEANSKLEQLKAPAESWGNVRKFMADTGLDDQDMLKGFEVMAMLKTQPAKAREELINLLVSVDDQLGLRLSDDLRKDVDEGRITEERARELSQERARAKSAEARAKAEREGRERTQAETQQRDAAEAFTAATHAWEQARREKDPDFAKKEGLIADRVRTLMAGGESPKTPQELTALLDKAHKSVTDDLTKFVPPPKPVARMTVSSGSTVAHPEPKSMREAVSLAAGARG